MYAQRMELLSRIFKVLSELYHLARTLFTDGMHFMALCARSRAALAAENLFLRKQLAFYQERKIKPRRFDNVSRLILVLLSHGFAWKDALVNIKPKTFIGVASRGIPTLLALEITPRATTDTAGTACTHPGNVAG